MAVLRQTYERGGRGWGTRAVAALAACALVPAVLVAPTPAAAVVCDNPPASGNRLSIRPPVERQLPIRQAWRISDGKNVTVAVIGSGVSATHEQLKGGVYPGFDFLTNRPNAADDCASEGTAAASIIAARSVLGVGLVGVAPGSYILPIRVVESAASSGANTQASAAPSASSSPSPGASGEAEKEPEPEPNPSAGRPGFEDERPKAPGGVTGETLAKAIEYAAANGATVIQLSVQVYTNVPELESAVQAALAKNIVIVAATGDLSSTQTPLKVPSYPAAYPGVIGVSAIDFAGGLVSTAVTGSYVKLVAPGFQLIGATRERGHALWTGSAYAAAFVSGTAALVRAAEPKLTQEQVAQRLYATADPAPGDVGYGYGIVDPYRAVTERTTAAAPRPLPAVSGAAFDGKRLAAEQAQQRTDVTAILLGLLIVVITLTVVMLAVSLPKGRKWRWAPGWTRRKPAKKKDDMPPPELLIHSPQTVFKVPSLNKDD